MNTFDHVKKGFSKKKNTTVSPENSEKKRSLIELYEKFEKEGFHFSRNRQEAGLLIDQTVGKFDIYNVTNTLFQNGTLIIDQHNDKVASEIDFHEKKEKEYSIVIKNENGEYIVIPRTKLKLEMRDKIPKFRACVEAAIMLENTLRKYDETQKFFKKIISGLENGSIEAKIQAKSVCVDARPASPEEVGTKFTVWSHGKVEKEITVAEDTVFLTTLDKDGKPIIDESGHYNTYDMSMKNFAKKYQKHPNGHFVQEPTPMVTIQLPDSVIPEEGIKLLPPCWCGYEGTLMRGGLVMLPFNPDLSREQQIEEWKQYLTSDEKVDWYPNNEADTYSPCDKNGTFIDKNLQELYGQNQSNRELS